MFMMLNISRNERSKVRSNISLRFANQRTSSRRHVWGGVGGGRGGAGTSIPSTPVMRDC